jgi:predicted transcriptional regulator
MNVILSIHSIYADAIYRNIKTVELRSIPPKQQVNKYYMYETAPKKLITGYFISEYTSKKMNIFGLASIYNFSAMLGEYNNETIALEKLIKLLGYNKKYCAIEIKKAVKFEKPIKLTKRPPQNFYYVDNLEMET